MKIAFPLLLSSSALLSACGEPEVEACEEFIKDGLKSPSSYKRASVSKLDETISQEMFLENHGKIDTFDKHWLDDGRLTQRIVAIEYDADNSFGASIRGAGICEFHLIDGELPSQISLDASVSMAIAQRSMRELGRAGLIPNEGKLDIPEPRYGCCEN